MKKWICIMTFILLLTGCLQQSDENVGIFVKSTNGETLLTEEDFSGGALNETEQGLTITIEVIDPEELYSIMEQHTGESLNFFLGDTLISSPRIVKPFKSESLLLGGEFSKEEAERFIEALN